MIEQASRHVQAFAVHDRMGGVAVSEVMKSCIYHDARLVAHPAPEQVKSGLA